MPAAVNAMERLSERILTLESLSKRGIVTGDLFSKQISALFRSRDAKAVFNEYVLPDKDAIKILWRLEDPLSWRKIFSESKDKREILFYQSIEKIMSSEDNQQEKIISILQLTCLPFYSGFVSFTNEKVKKTSKSKPSRVSVLD